MFPPKYELVSALSLFQTPLFRDSLWIQQLCEEVGSVYAANPYGLSESVGSHGHFATFFGVIVRRPWYQGVFHDLYVLHELWHRKTLKYQPDRSWMNWSRDLIASELASSITSECLVYFVIPELRRHTFQHEIWVDRFLEGGSLHRKTLTANLRIDPLGSIEAILRAARVRALAAPDHDDFLEHQIWNYGRQNMLWCRVWASPVGFGDDTEAPAFRVVNERMSTPNWREGHVAWLEELSDGPTYDSEIPFPRQAERFRPIYEQSLRDFGNDVLSR